MSSRSLRVSVGDQTFRSKEEDRRAQVDRLDGIHPDDVGVDGEGVPALGDLDRVAREEPPDEGFEEMSFHEMCSPKTYVCLTPMATRAALSAYDEVYLALSAWTTSRTTSQSPAASASWRTINPACLRAAGVRTSRKQGSNARGVALVCGVVLRSDDGERAKQSISGVDGCRACRSGLGINRSVKAFEYRSNETSVVCQRTGE